jgi:ribosomal protein S10
MKLTHQIKLKAINKPILTIYQHFLKTIFIKSGLNFRFFSNPIKIKRITLLKSPHVYKKAKEHFELRSYSSQFTIISNLKQQQILKFIKLNKPKEIKINLRKIA